MSNDISGNRLIYPSQKQKISQCLTAIMSDHNYEIDPNPFAPPKNTSPEAAVQHPYAQTITPAYLYTAINPKRRKVSNWIEAPTADDAYRMLVDQGFTDIVFHLDDLGAFFAPIPQQRTPLITRMWIDQRTIDGYFPLFWYYTKLFFGKTILWNVVILAVLIGSILHNKEFGFIEYFLCFWLVFPLVQAALAARSRASRLYHQMLDTIYWARWDDAEKLLRRLEGNIPRVEIILRKAQILAGRGRMVEAQQTASLLRDELGLPDWFCWARMIEVHLAAFDREAAIRCLDHAIELAPSCTAAYIDRSRLALRYEENIPLAEAMIAEAKRHVICDIHRPFVLIQDAMVRFEKGETDGVLADVRRAVAEVEKFARVSPSMRSACDQMLADLALVEAKLGDPSAAKRYYEKARPRLEALRMTKTLERCRQIFG